MSYTELESINDVLRPLGEGSITDVNSTDEEVVQAKAYLTKARKRVLTKGWYFNRSVITYTGGGVSGKRILIDPTTTIRVIPTEAPQPNLEFVVRYDSVETDYFLWDLTDETFEILDTAGDTIDIDTIKYLDFVDCPHAAQAHIIAVAAYEYHNETVGDPAVNASLQLALSQTWADLRRDQLHRSKPSMFSPRDKRLRSAIGLWRY